MAKGKTGAILVKLLSTAGTGFFYVKARGVSSCAVSSVQAGPVVLRKRLWLQPRRALCMSM